MFFSLSSAISVRQFDMASKTAFTASLALYERPGIDIGSKLRVVPADLLCVAMSAASLWAGNPLPAVGKVSLACRIVGAEASSAIRDGVG
jgi:hypothetical protein